MTYADYNVFQLFVNLKKLSFMLISTPMSAEREFTSVDELFQAARSSALLGEKKRQYLRFRETSRKAKYKSQNRT